jgi:hypothetical protein
MLHTRGALHQMIRGWRSDSVGTGTRLGPYLACLSPSAPASNSAYYCYQFGLSGSARSLRTRPGRHWTSRRGVRGAGGQRPIARHAQSALCGARAPAAGPGLPDPDLGAHPQRRQCSTAASPGSHRSECCRNGAKKSSWCGDGSARGGQGYK